MSTLAPRRRGYHRRGFTLPEIAGGRRKIQRCWSQADPDAMRGGIPARLGTVSRKRLDNRPFRSLYVLSTLDREIADLYFEKRAG
jgi:hypothetical protein